MFYFIPTVQSRAQEALEAASDLRKLRRNALVLLLRMPRSATAAVHIVVIVVMRTATVLDAPHVHGCDVTDRGLPVLHHPRLAVLWDGPPCFPRQRHDADGGAQRKAEPGAQATQRGCAHGTLLI